MVTMASFCKSMSRTSIAGVSRTSYVSFLKANHTTASFSVAVLKKGGNDFPARVCLWCSLLCGHLEAFNAGLQCADGIDLSLDTGRKNNTGRSRALLGGYALGGRPHQSSDWAQARPANKLFVCRLLPAPRPPGPASFTTRSRIDEV